MFYIVPTPIGNLEDITLRAIRILKESDLILAEDTRTSKKLLVHYGIDTPLKSFHAHNEHNRISEVINLLKEGQNISLISDAGTPGISDPGFLIVRACHQENIEITCLPGAAAVIVAVVASGLPCDKFHFEGFMPPKKGRLTRLKYLAGLPTTSVIYVSPHKVVKTFDKLIELCGPERKASLIREISKMYEEILTGTLASISEELKSRDKVKGELVLVLSAKD